MTGIDFSGAEALLRQSSLFSIPHDPASVVVYVLLAISGYAIWYGDRRARKNPEKGKTRAGAATSDPGSPGTGDEPPPRDSGAVGGP